MATNIECISSHNLVTDKLVQATVEKDAGLNAKAFSWEIIDFTRKGDNYGSYVTSVKVRVKIDEKSVEKWYVAKLNPLRPLSEISKTLDNFFRREVVVLSKVTNSFSSILKDLGLSELKVPKILAKNLTPGEEAIFMEDLRCKGFMMHDRKKGLDIQHAVLVVEELGRLHAASLLHQDTLPNKSLQETYGDVMEPWLEYEKCAFKIFENMILTRVESSKNFLKTQKGYEECIKWIEKHSDSHGIRFTNYLRPSGKFTVFNHGDCWTNNFLFRYDQNESPIEFCLVDFQICCLASVGVDLNFLLYSSLTGNIRKKNKMLFLVSYYTSFIKVYLMAGKTPPFTFEELEVEVEEKKLFGMYVIMLLITAILPEEEDIIDILKINETTLKKVLDEQTRHFMAVSNNFSTEFNERFLSVFDEMIESGLFKD